MSSTIQAFEEEFEKLLELKFKREIKKNHFERNLIKLQQRMQKMLSVEDYCVCMQNFQTLLQKAKKIHQDDQICLPQTHFLQRDKLNNDTELLQKIKSIEHMQQALLKELSVIDTIKNTQIWWQRLLWSSILFGGLTDLDALNALAKWVKHHLMQVVVFKDLPLLKYSLETRNSTEKQFEACIASLEALESAFQEQLLGKREQENKLFRNYCESLFYRQLSQLFQQLKQLKTTITPENHIKILSYLKNLEPFNQEQNQQLDSFLNMLIRPKQLSGWLGKINRLFFSEQTSLRITTLKKRWEEFDDNFWQIWEGCRLLRRLMTQIRELSIVHYPLQDEQHACVMLYVEKKNYGYPVNWGKGYAMPRLWRMDGITKCLLLRLLQSFQQHYLRQDVEDIETGNTLNFSVSEQLNARLYSQDYANLKAVLADRFHVITTLELQHEQYLDQFSKQIACFIQPNCGLSLKQWQMLQPQRIKDFEVQGIVLPQSTRLVRIYHAVDDDCENENIEQYFYYQGKDQKKALAISKDATFKQLLEQYQRFADELKGRQSQSTFSQEEQGVWHSYYRLVKFFTFKIQSAIQKNTTVKNFANERSLILTPWLWLCVQEKIDLRTASYEQYISYYQKLLQTAREYQEDEVSSSSVSLSQVGNKLRTILKEFHEYQLQEVEFKEYEVPYIDFKQFEQFEKVHVVDISFIPPWIFKQLIMDIDRKLGIFKGLQFDLTAIRLLFIILYRSGLRVSELLGIQIKDVIKPNSSEVYLRICRNSLRGLKSKRAKRRIPISLLCTAEENDLLNAYIHRQFTRPDNEACFIFNGQPIESRFLNEIFAKWQWNRLGQRLYRLHSFRHTAINQLFLCMHGDPELIETYTIYNTQHANNIRKVLLNREMIAQDKWLKLSDLFGHDALGTTAETYLHFADLIRISSQKQQIDQIPKNIFDALIKQRLSYDEDLIEIKHHDINKQCGLKPLKTMPLESPIATMQQTPGKHKQHWQYPLEIYSQLTQYEQTLKSYSDDVCLEPNLQIYWQRAQYIAEMSRNNRDNSRLVRTNESCLPQLSSEETRRAHFLKLHSMVAQQVTTWLIMDDFAVFLEVIMTKTRINEPFIRFYKQDIEKLKLILKFIRDIFLLKDWRLVGCNQNQEKKKIKLNQDLKFDYGLYYYDLSYKESYKEKTLGFNDFRKYAHLWMIMHPKLLREVV